MDSVGLRAAAAILTLFGVAASVADDTAKQPAPFKPFELVGDWKFKNVQTGVRYGGDIKATIATVDGNGTMRGKISFDGRQTNDKCSTKQLFVDVPVDVEVSKVRDEYRLTFQLPCLKGENPRIFSWTLVCEGMACVQPTVLPHGNGAITLREAR